MLKTRLSILAIGLLSSVFSFNVQAQDATTTTSTTYLIVSPAPKGTCTTVAGHWEGNVWVDAHEECKYTDRSEGSYWVNEYWSCTSSKPDGNCLTWVLVPGHWKTQ